MPKVDITLAQLIGATVFSKLDTNSGFWQMPLAKQSRLLTTFITHYGCFCFNKLLFGITSAHFQTFQHHMGEILQDLPGVVCHVDDVLVSGKDQREHDSHLHTVLQKIQAGLTLNKDKCKFSYNSHRLTKVHGNEQSTHQIFTSPGPPLRELLKANTTWLWTPHHDEAFSKLKTEISSPRVLAHYDINAQTKISADASAYGLGAVLLQCQGNLNWKPVAFASRCLNPTEIRYAQIEKEALGLVWACETFSDFVLGKSIFWRQITNHSCHYWGINF